MSRKKHLNRVLVSSKDKENRLQEMLSRQETISLGELSSEGKGKSAAAKKQLKAAHHKPLAQEDDASRDNRLFKRKRSFCGGNRYAVLRHEASHKKHLGAENGSCYTCGKRGPRPGSIHSHQALSRTKRWLSVEVGRLKKMGFHAYIQTVDLENGQTWHRIK